MTAALWILVAMNALGWAFGLFCYCGWRHLAQAVKTHLNEPGRERRGEPD